MLKNWAIGYLAGLGVATIICAVGDNKNQRIDNKNIKTEIAKQIFLLKI